AGTDRMFGGTGDDIYHVDTYNDHVIENAGEGNDSVIASDNYKLSDNIESLTLAGSANIWGYGNGSDNVLTGNSGANKLFGLGGNDLIDGGAGADRMWGGTGDDRYMVDNYNDRISELAGEGSDSVFASTSYKLADNIEKLTLTGSSDIWGYGNASDNVLTGNDGANKLYGLGGNDVLSGQSGNDWLEGGAGRDVTTGGIGADSFAFRDGDFAGLTASTCDQIKDFSESDGDVIRLLADADSGTTGSQTFDFIGTNAFTGAAGELRYEEISGNTYVMGDTDGDGTADFMIRLDGSHALTSGDFIFG
ncbi:MAG: calcium-binding protein, partial [Sphingomicrobium sp.]